MTLVAISASFGAGGSQIGPAVAGRLGVPFVDRAIPLAVAASLDVPLDDAAAFDEHAPTRWLDRLLRGFIGTDVAAPTPVPSESRTAEDFARATEEVIRLQARLGQGVILGRASVIVLRDRPDVLRVRLDGPAERRIRQGARLGGTDEEAARRTLEKVDRTHLEYARRFYGTDLRDASLYHLILDSTAVGLDASTEIILTAVASLAEATA